MKTYLKIIHIILLYCLGFLLSLTIYILYQNYFINPRLSKDIDKMIFAKYTFQSTDSTQVNLKETFNNKIRLIDFWTLNCSFCTDDLESFYNLDLTQNKDFVILAINKDEYEDWNDYLVENSIVNKNPQIIHFSLSDESILKKLEIEYYPTYFLLDEEGMIRSRCSYNFVLGKVNRILTNKTYFKDYLYDIYKYFPCGGLGRPTIAYSLIIFPLLFLGYYYFYLRKVK